MGGVAGAPQIWPEPSERRTAFNQRSPMWRSKAVAHHRALRCDRNERVPPFVKRASGKGASFPLFVLQRQRCRHRFIAHKSPSAINDTLPPLWGSRRTLAGLPFRNTVVPAPASAGFYQPSFFSMSLSALLDDHYRIPPDLPAFSAHYSRPFPSYS